MKMNKVGDTNFYKRLQTGPIFLFLGQKYLSMETGEDPLLSAILQKYGEEKSAAENIGYSALFNTSISNDNASLAWIFRRSELLSVPYFLEKIAQFAWSGVYTSAIDTMWLKAFKNDWREIQNIFNERTNPIEPRSRTRLNCTYLYGRVDQVESTYLPPLTHREYRKRSHQEASLLINRLPELITPLGHIFFEGYDFRNDWFALDDLLPILDKLSSNQVHIFSSLLDWENNKEIRDYIDEGLVTFHSESLAEFLSQAADQGYLKLGESVEDAAYGRQIKIGSHNVSVPTSLWNQVNRSATILSDSHVAEHKELSPESMYTEFREFLANSGSFPVWSGYSRGFAFERDYEHDLYTRVLSKLQQNEFQAAPIILKGQTGTGKTVALGHLGYKIRKDGRFPVLFITGGYRKPANYDIDAFCQWIKQEWETREPERSGIPPVLIIWDANDADAYYGLSNYLASRGNNFVIVGSSYKDRAGKNKNKVDRFQIEAPITLSRESKKNSKPEFERFRDFLNDFEPNLGEYLSNYKFIDDNSFLVYLYRLLPQTRRQIQTGILREYDKVESALTQLSTTNANENDQPRGNSLFAAFVKAGFFEEDSLLVPGTENIGGEEVSQPKKLIGFVMIPGSFGLRVPFDLLLRVLERDGLKRFLLDALEEYDIFNWHEEFASGVWHIGPRHPLEAREWTRMNIGGTQYEVEYMTKLMSEVKASGELIENDEVQFVVELVRNVRSDDTGKYNPFLKEIADVLRQLRTARSIEAPSLVLQEATLLREYVKRQSQRGRTPPNDTIEILDQAKVILERTITILEEENKNTSAYWGELAAILGTKFNHILTHAKGTVNALHLFEEAKGAAKRALSKNTDSYIPVDIASWITLDFLSQEEMSKTSKLEAQADILHLFDLIEAEDLNSTDREKLQLRKYEIGRASEQDILTEQAFQELERMGSAVGYYLRAKEIAPDIVDNKELSEVEKQKCIEAVNYLEQYRHAIRNDGRSLHLLLNTWWMSHTGKPFFYGERQTVAMSQAEWEYGRQIVRQLRNISELYFGPRIQYLYGLFSFQVNEIRESLETFKILEKEEHRLGGRRVLRSYLISDAQGEPQKYSGEVKWTDIKASKGGIFIPSLRHTILFSPREFNRPDIKKGESISDFHIAVNFLGPIADPATRFGRGRS